MAFWENESPTFETPLALILKALPPCRVSRHPQYVEISESNSKGNDAFTVDMTVNRAHWKLEESGTKTFERRIRRLQNMLENTPSIGYNHTEGDVRKVCFIHPL